jgi:hypothetical protein
MSVQASLLHRSRLLLVVGCRTGFAAPALGVCFADPLAHWLNVAGQTGMPRDRRLWTDNPTGTIRAAA